MKFYVSNTKDRQLDPRPVLHTNKECFTMKGANRRSWEATIGEIEQADSLCQVCVG
jgi:hypothetical protein